MNYHKLTKKLKKIEKKFRDYSVIAINEREVVTTSKGTKVTHDNLVKLPRIYKEVKNSVDYNPLAKKILDIIGE